MEPLFTQDQLEQAKQSGMPSLVSDQHAGNRIADMLVKDVHFGVMESYALPDNSGDLEAMLSGEREVIRGLYLQFTRDDDTEEVIEAYIDPLTAVSIGIECTILALDEVENAIDRYDAPSEIRDEFPESRKTHERAMKHLRLMMETIGRIKMADRLTETVKNGGDLDMDLIKRILGLDDLIDGVE